MNAWQCLNQKCKKIFYVAARFSGRPLIEGFGSATTVEKPCCPHCLSIEFEPYKPLSNLPKAVCLVGSTKVEWKKRYRQVEEELTKAGYVVLTVVWFRDQLPDFEKHRDLLEKVHFQKIRLADAVVLIHPDAVEKNSNTAKEIKFAEEIGKPVVTFMEIASANAMLELCWNRN